MTGLFFGLYSAISSQSMLPDETFLQPEFIFLFLLDIFTGVELFIAERAHPFFAEIFFLFRPISAKPRFAPDNDFHAIRMEGPVARPHP